MCRPRLGTPARRWLEQAHLAPGTAWRAILDALGVCMHAQSGGAVTARARVNTASIAHHRLRLAAARAALFSPCGVCIVLTEAQPAGSDNDFEVLDGSSCLTAMTRCLLGSFAASVRP